MPEMLAAAMRSVVSGGKVSGLIRITSRVMTSLARTDLAIRSAAAANCISGPLENPAFESTFGWFSKAITGKNCSEDFLKTIAAVLTYVNIGDCESQKQKDDAGKIMTQKRRRHYWLMKSEPGAFSLEDLKNSENGTAAWDGVRNYQARNFLRDEIKAGDGVLFYHSNIAKPAIVGLAEVVQDGYPDHTAQDPASDHYDPKATVDNPRWYMVDIRYLASLPEPLDRDALRRHPVLSEMAVLKKGSRLSVLPVTPEQWQAVVGISQIPDLLDPAQG